MQIISTVFEMIDTSLQYVYKVNAPSIDEAFTESFLKELLVNKSVLRSEKQNSFVAIRDTSNVFSETFKTFNDVNFDFIEIFLKASGYRGQLHRDHIYDDKHPWGINWVINGTSIMDYYDVHKLTPRSDVSRNSQGGTSTYYTSDRGEGQTPIKTYRMQEGIYLINGDVPHVATGTDNRIVLSARSLSSYNMSWDSVVNKFSHLIIK